MIEIKVHGSLNMAMEIFNKVCVTSGLVKDRNRHQYYEKRSTRIRKKHLRAFLKQRDENNAGNKKSNL